MSTGPDLARLRAGFASPPREAAPMMRWWWFGPAVERTELDRELTAMAAAGIGGVEVAYVYPLGPATTSFLSADFLADLRFAAQRARDLGLRFDLTLGSGWSFGGPHVGDDHAARRLHWDRREITPEARTLPVAPGFPGDRFVAAYLGDGSLQEQPENFTLLTERAGRVEIPAGAGPRQLLLAWSRPTGQNVKRAASGAEGPVFDHYSLEATRAHLGAVGDRLLDAVPAGLVGSVFCDSLEVYEADWTDAMAAEFEARCGYPLLPVLHRLAGDHGDPDRAARVRADYHRTLTRLYEDHFVRPVRAWAAARGVPFRIQGYGTPPAMISSYRFADLIEGEGWGWKRLTQTRWASSAAHLHQRPVVSSEVWTWVHSPSFRATPLDLLGEAHEHLLLGINAFVGHGWPYSPPDAPGLGWMFYAAGALDDRNPWWPAMPFLCAYLTRMCWLLRQGEPVADVAVLVPEDDVYARMGLAGGGSLDAWRETRALVGDGLVGAIREAGYDYDLLDADALAVVPADRYPVVLIPAGTTVAEPARKWCARVRAAGGVVTTATAGELSEELPRRARPDLRVTPTAPDVGFVHRRLAEADVWVVINTGPDRQTVTVRPRTDADRWQHWDPRSGAVVGSGRVADGVPLALHAYQAAVVITGELPEEPAPELPGETRDGTVVGRRGPALDGDWTVVFPGDHEQTVRLPHRWEDDDHRDHSGSARYRTVVELDPVGPADRVVLDFGDHAPGDDRGSDQQGMVGPSYRVAEGSPIGVVARVRLNGVDCGVAWAPPYEVELTGAVRAGRNELEVEVFNTAANALATDEHIVRLAAEAEARDGRRFRMQQLDLAMVGVSSGLLAVPTIVRF